MTLQSKRWQIKQPVNDQDLARLPGLPPLVVQLLFNRKIDEPESARQFLDSQDVPGDPFKLKGMNKAVTRLRQAIDREERIAVYGDFDADGVTATALLVDTLSALGARVQAYIPHRVNEGYGLNIEALRDLYKRGVRVIVTADCGIRAIKEVELASPWLAMIITDHHTVGDQLPPALTVINPKRPDCPYPFKKLAGVGVAFKLAQGLLRVAGQTKRPAAIPEESLLDLVALGTVADLVPLVGENRVMVQHGLRALNDPARPGVEALMANAGLRKGTVDATAIGFRLGPRINAAGRIDTAMLAYRLLTSRDRLAVRDLANKLGELNNARQQLTHSIVAAAEKQALADDPGAFLFLAADKEFKAGVVGLAASRLTEATYRPSIVVEKGKELSRGSCRSIPEFHITHALDECAHLLTRHGGHAAAAGFTAPTENLDELKAALQAIAARELAGQDLRPTLEIDAEIPLEEATWDTLSLLRQIEPCGIDNEQPVLLSRNTAVHKKWTMGKEHKHLKLILHDQRGRTIDAVAWNQGDLLDQIPGRVDVVYKLENNEWNHQETLQLVIQDIRASAT